MCSWLGAWRRLEWCFRTVRDVILIVVNRSDCGVACNRLAEPTNITNSEKRAMYMSEEKIRAALKLGPRPKPQFGNNRSHALNATRRQFKPNLQSRRVLVNGQERKLKLSAREIRTLNKRGRMLLAE